MRPLKKVFISTSTFGKSDKTPLEILSNHGYKAKLNTSGRTLKEDEIIPLIQGYEGLIAGTEKLSRDTLVQLKDLKVISRVGIGLDGIDLQAAEELGIKIFNTPNAPCSAVAELTLGLILDLMRMISRSDHEIRQGKWVKHIGKLLSNKTVGIIGIGRIGRKLTSLLKPFDCKILGFDPFPDSAWAAQAGVEVVPFQRILKESDIVTLHLPFSKENHHVIGVSEIALMKDGAYLINAARGGLVDESALFEGLKGGHLAGAAVDTFENEPYQGTLKELPNVILTAHIGACALECRLEMEIQAALNLIDAFVKIRD